MKIRFFAVADLKDEPIYQSLFALYLRDYQLNNLRSVRLGELLELTFNVRLKKPTQSQTFIKELSALEGIERASIVVSESSLTNQ